jgi:hypothetical protein
MGILITLMFLRINNIMKTYVTGMNKSRKYKGIKISAPSNTHILSSGLVYGFVFLLGITDS